MAPTKKAHSVRSRCRRGVVGRIEGYDADDFVVGQNCHLAAMLVGCRSSFELVSVSVDPSGRKNLVTFV